MKNKLLEKNNITKRYFKKVVPLHFLVKYDYFIL